MLLVIGQDLPTDITHLACVCWLRAWVAQAGTILCRCVVHHSDRTSGEE
jgi:hypothetical protein